MRSLKSDLEKMQEILPPESNIKVLPWSDSRTELFNFYGDPSNPYHRALRTQLRSMNLEYYPVGFAINPKAIYVDAKCEAIQEILKLASILKGDLQISQRL